MHDPRSNDPLLEVPRWARFAVGGIVLALFAYLILTLDNFENSENTDDPVEHTVLVPELDEELLATTKDGERSDRLQLEREPLRHLLGKSIDVGPTVAAALNMPAEMVPIAELRADVDKWRHRWLWYEGKLTQQSEGRPGHPIEGYKIYEATIELADGEPVMVAFSIPGKQATEVGDWVRVEGYLMKLRDATYPTAIDRAPMLIGRTIHRDYEDWPPVTSLDPAILDQVQDKSFYIGGQAFRNVDEDQCEALWHLGAFARDTKDERSFEDWRKVPVLDTGDVYDELIAGNVERGRPMRIFGTLIRRQTIAAPPNPANIKFWTAVLIEAHQFGGQLIPIWVPKRVRELPRRVQLEVCGYYYRWWAYDARSNRYKVPLFVAEDLQVFDLDTEGTMRESGMWVAGAVGAMLLLVVVGQWRMARTARQHSRDMDRRRRRRREKMAANADSDASQQPAD